MKQRGSPLSILLAILFSLCFLSGSAPITFAASHVQTWPACPDFNAIPHGNIARSEWIAPVQNETVQGVVHMKITGTPLPGKRIWCIQFTATYPGGPQRYIVACLLQNPTGDVHECVWDPSQYNFPRGVIILSYDITDGAVGHFSPNGSHLIAWEPEPSAPDINPWFLAGIGLILGIIIGLCIGLFVIRHTE